MKKTIIVSLLICILAGNVFAQVTFSGEAYAGFQYENSFNGDNIVTADHRKEGAPKFNFQAVAQRADYGIKLDVDFQTTNPLTLNGIYGWAYFLDDSIHFTVGKISDGKFVSSLDADHEYEFDSVTGIRVEYRTPFLEGLNLGLAVPALGGEGNYAGDYKLERMAKKIILGASYVTPLFNTIAAYDLGNNARFLFGFNFTGIDELTSAGIQIRANNLATFDYPVIGGSVQINEKIGYRIMRPLIANLFLSQTFYGEEDKDMALTFNPSVSYKILPNLTGSFSLDVTSTDLFKSQVITFTPCIEYNLKGPALVYAQYDLIIARYKGDSFHRFGLGIDIKAF